MPEVNTQCPTAEAMPKEEVVYHILGELRDAARTGRRDDEAWKHHALMQYGIYKQFLSSPESCRATTQKRAKSVAAKTPDSPDLPYLTRLTAALEGIHIQDSPRYKLLVSQLREMRWNGTPATRRYAEEVTSEEING